MILTNDLQAKWQPVLEHADLPKIDGAAQAFNYCYTFRKPRKSST